METEQNMCHLEKDSVLPYLIKRCIPAIHAFWPKCVSDWEGNKLLLFAATVCSLLMLFALLSLSLHNLAFHSQAMLALMTKTSITLDLPDAATVGGPIVLRRDVLETRLCHSPENT